MNKIFKVIWSKSRNCYVVASELAKGRTKAASTGDKAKRLALAAITALMLLLVGGYSYAADTTTTVEPAGTGSATAVEVYTQKGADTTFVKKGSDNGQSLTIGASESEILSTHQYVTGAQTTYDGLNGQVVTQATGGKSSISLKVGNSEDLTYNFTNYSEVTTTKDGGTTFTYHYEGGAQPIDNKTTIKGNTVTTGRVTASNGVVDETTTEGVSVKTTNTVGQNLSALDTRITNVKEYLEKQTSDTYVSKDDAAVQDGAIVKADKTIGENVTNLDAALAKETAARIGADKAQDAVIQQVNQNAANGIATLATAYNNEVASREAADNELNERITNEANEIHKTTNKLQDDLNTETTAREAADTALDTRITNVKEYLEKQTSDHYVSKADAAVQDGAIVKAANTIGENVTNLDAALAKETAARIGADAAQDKVIEQVNQNMVDGFNTINTNMANGFAALNAADAAEKEARIGADKKLAEAVNSGLSLSDKNVLQKNKTSVAADGTVTTTKEAATTLVMNEGTENQITLSENGIKVGLNSTVQDAKGFYAGGDNAEAAKAALNADGSIKGADGKFTVDTAGNVATKGGSIKTNGGIIQTGGGNINTQGGALRTNGGNINAGSGTITGNKLTDGVASLQNGDLTTTGNINAHDIVATGDISGKAITGTSLNTQGGSINGGAITGTSINGTTGTFGSLETTGNASVAGTLTSHGINNTGNTTTDSLTVKQGATVGGSLAVTGDITGKSLSVTGDITGKQITGTGLDVGAGLIKTTGSVETGTLETTGNATIGGNLTVDKNLTVNGEFNAKTLSSKLDENNYTTINGGKTQSMNLKMDAATGETKASASTFDENGSNTWAKDDDSIGKSTVTADSISQKLSNTGDNPTAYAESTMSHGTDNKYTMTDTVKDGDKTNVAFQSATESSDVVTDANGNTSTFRQRVDAILQEMNNADNTKSSSVEQKLDSINSKVTDGTNTTSMEQGTTDITNKAEQGTISNIAKDLVNTATGNMTNTVGGKMLNDVTGDMENKVGGELKTTVTGKVTEDYKSDLSTKVGGDETHAVTGNQTTTVSGNRTVNVKGTE
ncbi:MAG: ESPR-type extended signal peptide-containing protein, partial [Caecibacter massiliensis]|nr:ESPR-type extended signal peptide-containing protein [Caecibacter massiliensis]